MLISLQARRLVAESMLAQGYVWDKEFLEMTLYHQSILLKERYQAHYQPVVVKINVYQLNIMY